MIMNAKITLLIFLFLPLTIRGWCQNMSEKYLFKSLEVDLGLSNSNVLSIFRDSDGFMWFGTASGLNRSASIVIKTCYRHNSESSALSNNYISKIYVGTEKSLWIRNVNGIFKVYQTTTEYFERNIE